MYPVATTTEKNIRPDVAYKELIAKKLVASVTERSNPLNSQATNEVVPSINKNLSSRVFSFTKNLNEKIIYKVIPMTEPML